MREEIFPLPVRVEDVTTPWLNAALGQYAPDVAITDSEVLDVVFSTCTKIRIRLNRNGAAVAAGIPEQVIVKGGFEEHGRVFDHMHLREVRGYRDVYPYNPLPHPQCYFADFDAEARQGIIIMEDLVTKGVEFCHATKPQTFDQVTRRLDVLAQFHAASWDSPELKPGGRWGDLVEFFDVMQPFFDDKTSEENWHRFMGMPRGVATSRLFQDRDWICNLWPKMRAYSNRLPHCVLHGDTHLGNLYIEPDGTPGFLDTLASRGPGMMEVTYHIVGALDVADRPCWERALVQRYIDGLGNAGVKAPDMADAMHQYAVFHLYGYLIWITTESHYQDETVNTVNAMRSTMAMLDHDTSGVISRL